jgi:FMN phosphatase YigB (HAD superfamily)/carbamoylphosphate synthase large subunit
VITVLVVSGGGFQGLGLVRALMARDELRVVVCDCHGDNPTRYLADQYEVVPTLADPGFGDALRELCMREGVTAIFPATAHELPALARLSASFEAAGITVAVSPPAVIDALLDKSVVATWLDEAGIATQVATALETGAALPLLGKPRLGWGGQGMRVLDTPEVLATQMSAADSDAYLWVPKLESFIEYSIDVALGPLGERTVPVVRQRLRTSGGFAVISESVSEHGLDDLIVQVLNMLARRGAHGLFNIQIIVPAGGMAFVSDINPRLGTSATHALAEGMNLPVAYLAMRGRVQASAAQARRMVKSVRLLHDQAIPRLPPVRGVVFDLDDTLVDHKRWIYARFLSAGRDARLSAALAAIGAEAWRLIVARVLDEGERRHLVDRVAELSGLDRDTLLAAYREGTVDEAPLYRDVVRTLTRLHRSGIRIAILTDNPVPTQQAKLAALPAVMRDCIDAVVFGREHGGEKPHAGGFLAASAALGLAPAECAMVGDDMFRDGVGAIEAGYADALIVSRPGGFVQPHPAFYDLVPPRIAAHLHRIEGLASLLFVWNDL